MKNVLPCGFAGGVCPPTEALALQQLEEAVGDGVVMAASPAAAPVDPRAGIDDQRSDGGAEQGTFENRWRHGKTTDALCGRAKATTKRPAKKVVNAPAMLKVPPIWSPGKLMLV